MRIDRNAEAAAALQRQIELVPRDDDAYHALGMALRSLPGREEEAISAYRSALAIEPKNFQTHSFLASVLGELGRYDGERDHYRLASAIRPHDVKTHINLGICHTSLDEMEEAEQAFLQAKAVGPNDALPPLNMGRFLTKLGRPAEAIAAFYEAAAIDAEYFKEVKLGVGTARAQQGRLAEATAAFESASRMDPKNLKLRDSLAAMAEQAKRLSVRQEGLVNAIESICGTPCQDVVDGNGLGMCAVAWEAGCGEQSPPAGFTAQTTVGELCAFTCAASQLPAPDQS